jgi:hypothetical protein
MFEISEETRNAAIEEMREILHLTMEDDEDLGKAFDAAVAIVKRQFGM